MDGRNPSFGELSSYVFRGGGTQHVFYTALDNEHIYEISWGTTVALSTQDLTHRTGASTGQAVLASHAVEAEGTHHVFHAASDQHINELWWLDGDQGVGDLTAASGSSALAGFGPTSHVVDFEVTQHVFFAATTGHVIELWWFGGQTPHAQDLTLESQGAPLAQSQLCSFVIQADGSQHVFYNSGGHIIEMSHAAGQPWQWRDLHVASGERQLAASSPAAHFFAAEGTQHVFFINEDRHVIELWWSGSEPPHPEDLTARAQGAPAPFLELASHAFEAEGTQHVFYRGTDGRIIEIWWPRGGAPHAEDLTHRTGGPLASLGGGGVVSHVFDAEGTQHVFYADTNGGITELWSSP